MTRRRLLWCYKISQLAQRHIHRKFHCFSEGILIILCARLRYCMNTIPEEKTTGKIGLEMDFIC